MSNFPGLNFLSSFSYSELTGKEALAKKKLRYHNLDEDYVSSSSELRNRRKGNVVYADITV